ncbi:tyrosine-type recombinase/integrase [Metabacillus litoralis]|uniref:tyrosine-type recombinase/integrase n=1 Tax=Metabacillus litoralis TaxID=152268 RepID=UPI001CFEB9EE|nr:tyrosine-type recombinase/integrase [Metabacillus litoralis]
MKNVEAIKSEEQLASMQAYLKTRSHRDYCLLLLGINTGIRIYDLLHLRVGEFLNEDHKINEFLHFSIYKSPPIYLNERVRDSVVACISHGSLRPEDYLFKSKKTSEPITRQQAYRIINDSAKQAGITEAIGTHTLRKTFGYHAYKKGIAISLIQKRLQQSSPSETKQYIGIMNDSSIEIRLDVNL